MCGLIKIGLLVGILFWGWGVYQADGMPSAEDIAYLVEAALPPPELVNERVRELFEALPRRPGGNGENEDG